MEQEVINQNNELRILNENIIFKCDEMYKATFAVIINKITDVCKLRNIESLNDTNLNQILLENFKYSKSRLAHHLQMTTTEFSVNRNAAIKEENIEKTSIALSGQKDIFLNMLNRLKTDGGSYIFNDIIDRSIRDIMGILNRQNDNKNYDNKIYESKAEINKILKVSIETVTNEFVENAKTLSNVVLTKTNETIINAKKVAVAPSEPKISESDSVFKEYFKQATLNNADKPKDISNEYFKQATLNNADKPKDISNEYFKPATFTNQDIFPDSDKKEESENAKAFK